MWLLDYRAKLYLTVAHINRPVTSSNLYPKERLLDTESIEGVRKFRIEFVFLNN